MGITEIVLIIIGVLIFAASFLIPERLGEKDTGNVKEQEKKLKVFFQKELQNIRIGIEEKVDESMVASTEKTERYMERLTNEKIMAIQEYSDTVLEQIHKNHEEAVFLYDMLNNKHDQIKNTAGEINISIDGAREKLDLTIQDTVRELLRGSIRENLVEKIQNMLQETVQEAIDNSIKSNLQEKIDIAVEEEIHAAVSRNLMDVIKEEIGRMVQETVSDSSVTVQSATMAQSVSMAVEESAVLSEKPAEAEPEFIIDSDAKEALLKKDDNKEGLESEFKGFSFELPEVVMEEEQPLLVQSVKKVTPKKKTPVKKSHPRTLSTLGGQMENEPQAYFEPVRNTANGNGNKDKILQLHKEGMSDVAIAKELGMGIGEVKLIIGLFE